MNSPMAQIRGIRDPDMSPERRHRPMDQRPRSIDPPWKERRIFIVRRHDHAHSLKRAEVLRHGQRHTRAAARIGRVGHRVFLQFRHVGYPRIFDAPQFLRKMFRVRQKRRFFINLPSINAIFRARHAQVRKAAAIFHAAEQKRGAIGQQCCAGVENAIHQIGPVFCGQDRIRRVPAEQRIVFGHYLSQEQSENKTTNSLGLF